MEAMGLARSISRGHRAPPAGARACAPARARSLRFVLPSSFPLSLASLSLLLLAPFATVAAGPAGASDVTRAPILAGSWYPASPPALRDTVGAYLDGAERKLASVAAPRSDAPVAILAPHAGYVFSGRTAALAYSRVRGRRYDRVILLAPSHRVAFDGGALPDAGAFATPLGDCPVDREAIAALSRARDFAVEPRAHAREHAIEIQLPLLQVALEPGFRIVPIVIGSLNDDSMERMRRDLAPLLGPGTLLVVSSDFTHYGPDYGYVPFPPSDAPTRLPALDDGAIEAILAMSPDRFAAYGKSTGITICGAEPIQLALSLLSRTETRSGGGTGAGSGVEAERLGVARSGEMLSDWTNSVSYVAIALYRSRPGDPGEKGAAMQATPEDSTPETREKLDSLERSFLLDLARRTVDAAVRGRPLPEARAPAALAGSPLLDSPRGVFVTLTERGRLRGCIGSILPVDPLMEAVLHQAGNAALRDPRFYPVTIDELDRISIEISVLTPLREVPDARSIEIGRHGVLLTKRGRSAVFLPQVAPEQGWDRETMLRELCHKAGLSGDDWREGARLEVFEAQVFSEEEARGEAH